MGLFRRVADVIGAIVRAVADLVGGCRCAGCSAAASGGALCAECRALLRRAVPVVGAAPGLDVPLVAAADYAGVFREALLAAKEHGRVALAAPLGAALARAVAHALDVTAAEPDSLGPVAVVLVPVPTSARARRARHDDPLLRMTRQAARELRRQAIPAIVVPLLRVRGSPRDQAGLSAAERAVNVRGVFTTRRSAVLPGPRSAVIVVDDVCTTGATAVDAVRAARVGGVAVTAVAVLTRAGASRPAGGGLRSVRSHGSAIREV